MPRSSCWLVSISICACTASATLLSRDSTAAHIGTRPKISRARRYARTTSWGRAPVVSANRCTYVLPTRLIMLFRTCVAMLSRFRGWRSMYGAYLVASCVGK